MRPPHSPRLEPRREKQFEAELLERARAWLPSWALTEDEPDFGRALLKIAARFNSEVAERLDRGGEKLQRGFLDWLAVRGIAARPARMPVVLKLADNAPDPVLAAAPVRMQADTDTAPVVFETEADVCLLPGELKSVVGVDADHDAFYLPPPRLSDLKPLDPLPTQWQLKSFAAAGATKLQLDPDTGLDANMILEALGAQYTIVQVDKDIVTITPPLAQGLIGGQVVQKVTAFAPFDGPAQNWQEHALYLGDSDLLNIEAAAQIEVVGAKGIGDGVSWQYWAGDEKGWQPLTLASEQPSDGVLLSKLSGAIETKEIDGKSSRWIRAYAKTASGNKPILSPDSLQLRVNCNGQLPCPASDGSSSLSVEAMTNTTPLVLSDSFYPLGREPRLFDAFYLGCAEAFSKKGADATVCFVMADSTCFAYAAVRHGTYANKVLAGVGRDKALHLFSLDSTSGAMKTLRGPLRPPRPAEPGEEASSPNSFSLNSRCKPVIWKQGASGPDDFFVGVASEGAIWTWHENTSDTKASGWKKFSSVGNISGKVAQIDDILVLPTAAERPSAILSSGRVLVFQDPDWIELRKSGNPPLQDYVALAPISDNSGDVTDSMVGISSSGKLYRIELDGSETLIAPSFAVDIGTDHRPALHPAAVDDGTHLYVVALNDTGDKLVALQELSSAPQEVMLLDGAEIVGSAITVARVAGQLQFLVGVKTGAASASILSWTPTFVASDPTLLLETPIPGGSIDGTPLIAGDYIVVPGSRGDAYVAPCDFAQRLSFTTKTIIEGAILPGTAPFVVGDFISVLLASGTRDGWQVTKTPRARGSDLIYAVDLSPRVSVADDPQMIGYLAGATGTGTRVDDTSFTLTAADPLIVQDAILRVDDGTSVAFCKVVPTVTTTTVTVDATTPLPAGTPLSYWRPTPVQAAILPAIEFDPLTDGNWNAAILDHANFYFPVDPTPQPSPQHGTAGVVSNHPAIVALQERWTSFPPPLTTPSPFIIDAAIGLWKHQIVDTASNPELSWEYSNGKSWWSLPVSEEGTNRLASTGAVKFKVPDDIAEFDWSGKTDFWIRARLVGGDFGREEIKVVSTPVPNTNETVQTVERSTDNIKAPIVLGLRVSYSICESIFPSYLLTQDSGSIRDQSDANRTPGAIVEVFVPLGVTLARLSGTAALTTTPPPCPPPCNCSSESATAPTASGSTPPAAAAVVAETGRSLFLGFTKPLSQQPVTVLLLVDQERHHGAFAPLKVEALIGDRFVPIVTHDTTRALGELGLLSMSFSVGPTQRELFGQPLYWLHLKPAATDSSGWKPTLRGAYLNAVWASATETMTRELVGSSAGEPNLTLFLGRPPLLYNTLELRVREPLGQEAREAFLAADKNLVKSSEQDLPGDWVLWKQVVDPADADPGARLYALDETTGEIRFGDGRHGAIPPIGSDSIVAFTYQRTEAGPAGSTDVPANSIAERTQLGLVSPVPSVESAISADHAAGGAPPEPPDRVVRFGTARLRHRGRAVTARDLEDLALQSSPKIAQARCFVRPSYVKLVVVMQEQTHAPSAAQVRELRSLLLTSAPAALGVNQALRIQGPDIRVLRVALLLTITNLDLSGEVASDAKQRVKDLFDAATGGIAKNGWQLGQNPDPSDIAYVLSTVDRLEEIERIDLTEILSDGSERPWTGSLQPTELAVLSDDPVRINFNVVEVVA